MDFADIQFVKNEAVSPPDAENTIEIDCILSTELGEDGGDWQTVEYKLSQVGH